MRFSTIPVRTAVVFLACWWLLPQRVDAAGEGDAKARAFLQQYCVSCHGADTMESGIRVDQLDGEFPEPQLRRWRAVGDQIANRSMPPEEELQPSDSQRVEMVTWIEEQLRVARLRPTPKVGSIRRLTVTQFQNTLHDLLGLRANLTNLLPADAVSKDGFVNNQSTLQLDPLLVQAYFDIASDALTRAIVDPNTTPQVQAFEVRLGKAINPNPCPDELILGANSHLLANEDFQVLETPPVKPFAFEPIKMRRRFRFIEGYQGNDTVRGWRDYDSLYHNVFACMRGSEGYPKGTPYELAGDGLLLRPAIPSDEIFAVDSTYGPKANFKISLRELPDAGRFRVTVTARRYNDALLLDEGEAAMELSNHPESLVIDGKDRQSVVEVQHGGIYQIDAYGADAVYAQKHVLRLSLDGRSFSTVWQQPALMLVKLPAGELMLERSLHRPFVPRLGPSQDGDDAVVTDSVDRIVLTPVDPRSDLGQRFQTFAARSPWLGVHVGLRRDCGSTLAPVGRPQLVANDTFRSFVFEGEISNYPSPDVEADNVNYLAGFREIGVRNEFTDGRDRPRLLIESVRFEGPFYESWPPRSHQNLFAAADASDQPEDRARAVIAAFATKAYRRPLTDDELNMLMGVWRNAFSEHGDVRQSIHDTLVIVITSPQFLLLVENSRTPEGEPLDPWELASKLSYFLWNTMPDDGLIDAARDGQMLSRLDQTFDRLIHDERFDQFIEAFASQWLSLEKLDIVETDRERFPSLTRHVKASLRREPVEWLKYLILENRPIEEWIRSDEIIADEIVAAYYGLGDRTESGFEFTTLKHDRESLGGLLSQAGILAGLSDGREANPVKRGAWLARKIIADPPDDPPPNVPALGDDLSGLSLRERLEKHRDQKGCANCHAGIDPWGIPFQRFDASGRFQPQDVDSARSTLPGGKEVAGLNELKAYLAEQVLDQVAFSFTKHLMIYGCGRTLGDNELEQLKRETLECKAAGYPMQDLLRRVIHSKLFLEK